MTIKEKLYTAEELLRLPDDAMRRELVRGERSGRCPCTAQSMASSREELVLL